MESFVKELTETDCGRQMAIPVELFPHLPHYEGGRTIPLRVHDHVFPHVVWENFGYYKRREGHPKPVFQGDWRLYVRAKFLVPGDRVIFRVERNAANATPARYSIAAQKRVNFRLFGVYTNQYYWSEEF